MSKKNAEEDYITTPISVLAYIAELEAEREALKKAIFQFKENPISKNKFKMFDLIEGKGDE